MECRQPEGGEREPQQLCVARHEVVDFWTPDLTHTVVVSPLPGARSRPKPMVKVEKDADDDNDDDDNDAEDDAEEEDTNRRLEEDDVQSWLMNYFSSFGLVYSVRVVHENVALVRFYFASDAEAARKLQTHHRGQREFSVRESRPEDRANPRVPMPVGKCCVVLDKMIGRYKLTAEPRPVALLRLDDDGRVVLRTRAILELPMHGLRVVGTGFSIYEDGEENVLGAAPAVVTLDETQREALRKDLEAARVPPRHFRHLGEAMHNTFNVARVACFLQIRLVTRALPRNRIRELVAVYREA
ncbi:Hypothetical Protein FCC1311_062682 [Hondaea fermentalgiana]|uniref:Uncharacterized protein n=1 Tax=Hondaea fermentalgiana TaxID=2315210 RepID=A0A2R5GJZ2_9STRA|nr:Hypothetical Protein FCC1311_062682 [Hondaea fermentalgiana]|eukprot:GBG30048.1 Hypothetical Protein FCC1311_062682 [Hondaea fermentalgiana]